MQSRHGRKADIWSIGCTVLQLLTGSPPWKDKAFISPAALMYHIVNAKKPPELPNTLSSLATSFLSACFQWEPEKRPSADELLAHPFLDRQGRASLYSSSIRSAVPTKHDLPLPQIRTGKAFVDGTTEHQRGRRRHSHVPIGPSKTLPLPVRRVRRYSDSLPQRCDALEIQRIGRHGRDRSRSTEPQLYQHEHIGTRASVPVGLRHSHDSSWCSHQEQPTGTSFAREARKYEGNREPARPRARRQSHDHSPRRLQQHYYDPTEQPIGTSYAEQERKRERLNRSMQEHEQQRRNQQWQAELAAELEHRKTQTSNAIP